MSKDKIIVSNINDILVVRKTPSESRVFLTTGDSFIISRSTFITLLNNLVTSGQIPPEVLEGILEEYNTE